MKRLQAELSKANEVHAELSQQKQENMILKETIDRLRYDLDDLRTAHANDSTKGGSSAPGSTMPSLSRSLGSELLRRLNPTETVDEGEESDATVEDETVEKIEGGDGEEDVFQTIITRKVSILYTRNALTDTRQENRWQGKACSRECSCGCLHPI